MNSGFAVDFGGTKIAAAHIQDGTIVERLQIPTEGDQSFEAQIDAIGSLLEKLGYRQGTPLGVAVAGRIDASGHWHAVNKNTLAQIGGHDLRGALSKRFDVPVHVMNDAQAAALAEATLGAGQGAGHFAYLTVSTGVGGAVVLNGRPIVSRNGLAGHIGFVTSPYGDDPCGSGRKGTLEAIASGRAIARFAKLPDAKAAFETPTAMAEKAIERSAFAIGNLCADLNAIFGLDRVAIGGSVGLAASYLERVRMAIADQPELFQVPVVAASLGNDSALLGVLLGIEG